MPNKNESMLPIWNQIQKSHQFMTLAHWKRMFHGFWKCFAQNP